MADAQRAPESPGGGALTAFREPEWLNGPVAALAVVVGPMLVGLIGLDRSPVTWADEVFYVDPARALVERGRLIAPVFAGVRGLDQHFFLQPPFGFLIQAGVFAVLGFGKWQARLPGLLEYGASIALLQALLRRAGARPWIAAGAALVFACDSGIIEAYRSGRPDLLAVALELGSLLALTTAVRAGARERGFVLAGLLAGAAAMTHAALLVLLPGVCLAAALSGQTGPERARRLGATAIGAVLPLTGWLPWILQAPDLWVEQFARHVTGATSGPPRSLARIMADHGGHLTYFAATPLAFVTATVLLVMGARYLVAPARLTLVCLATSTCVLLSRENFIKLYVALLYVTAALCLEGLLRRGLPSLRAGLLKPALAVVVLSCVPIPLARAAVVLLQWRARDEKPLIDLVHAHVPPGVPIVGSAQGYYAAVENGDTYYYDYPLLSVRLSPIPQDAVSFSETMDTLRPRYFLLNSTETPDSLRGFPPHTSSEVLARYQSPSLNLGFIQKTGFDIVLWKVTY